MSASPRLQVLISWHMKPIRKSSVRSSQSVFDSHLMLERCCCCLLIHNWVSLAKSEIKVGLGSTLDWSEPLRHKSRFLPFSAGSQGDGEQKKRQKWFRSIHSDSANICLMPLPIQQKWGNKRKEITSYFLLALTLREWRRAWWCNEMSLFLWFVENKISISVLIIRLIICDFRNS